MNAFMKEREPSYEPYAVCMSSEGSVDTYLNITSFYGRLSIINCTK